MNIIKKLLITSLVVTLSGCITSSSIAQIDNHALQIQFDTNKTITGHGEIIYKNRVNLTNIYIDQYVYKLDSELILSYEDAVVGTTYQFNYGVNRMLSIIFSEYNTSVIDNKVNLYFIELKNETEVIYLILNNINKKRYKFIYGFNKDTFNGIYNSIMNDKEVLVHSAVRHDKDKIISNPQKYIHSNWNPKNIVLDTILQKVGGRIRQ